MRLPYKLLQSSFFSTSTSKTKKKKKTRKIKGKKMSSSSCSSCCQLFILVVMTFFFVQPCFSDDTKELMDKICHQTTDYVFCMNTFNSHPGEGILGLSHIALSQSLIHASTTQNVIRRLINNEPDKRKKDLFRICQEAYGVIMDQFELAGHLVKWITLL